MIQRHVVVVGRDEPLWLAALFLQRTLGPAGIQVTAVELPSMLTNVDVLATLPSLRELHRLIGLKEAAVLSVAAGTPIVAQRYVDWGRSSFLQGFDSEEPPGGPVSFVQLWAKARLAGLSVPFEEFSYGAMAARFGLIPLEDDDPKALGASYGYHLNAAAYAMVLRALSERRGIRICISASVRVDVIDESIEAVELDDGVRLEADLFVDATGSEASLISRLSGGCEFESWRAFLPCDRVLTASAPVLDPLPPFSQITALDHGWAGLFPLQDRTAVVAVYQSTGFDDQQAVSAVQSIVGAPIAGTAISRSLDPGLRRLPWFGNCVAIGEAAAVLEPLDCLPLHMTHVCLAHLVNLFPVTNECEVEAAEYNRVVRLHLSNLRDFQQAHYKLNSRTADEFWRAARAAPVSDVLARKLRTFEARGLPAPQDEETFEPHSWASMFLGHGLFPRDHDPRLDMIGEQDHIQAVQSRLREIGAAVPRLPTMESFLTANRIPSEGSATAS